MRLIATIPPDEYEIETNDLSSKGSVVFNGKEKKASLTRLSYEYSFLLLLDYHLYQIFIEEKNKKCVVRLNNRTYHVELENERARLLRHLRKADHLSDRQNEIKAPMPGLIVKVNVKVGQQIKKGDSLFIIEAMKMENEIRSPADGRVKKIHKYEKESVEKDQVLMLVE